MADRQIEARRVMEDRFDVGNNMLTARPEGATAVMAERSENMKTMLDIRHYSKTYNGGKKAADDVSLTIESGDIYGFIGHNGAGKTTTIRAVVGVLDFTEGEIFIDGHSVKEEPMECKKVTAYIPDNPDIYENLTGLQYLNFVADVFDISASDREERIKKYAGMFDITDPLGDMISSYSHGMKQKVAIISALIHEPKLMVMDEPFVGLDPKASFTLKEIMRGMCRDGAAIFFSTHVLDVAEKLCNKVAIIKNGRIIASGTMDEITEGHSLEEAFLGDVFAEKTDGDETLVKCEDDGSESTEIADPGVKRPEADYE